PLLDRVAVVTGATGGLGSAICRDLAGAGARVVATFRRHEAAAHSLMEHLTGEGHVLVKADVTDSATLGHLAREVDERYGTVDLLVNGVGTTSFVRLAVLAAVEDEARGANAVDEEVDRIVTID